MSCSGVYEAVIGRTAMQTIPEQLEQRVIDWVAAFLRIVPAKVSLSSSVNLDLGVDGGDGLELIRAFGDEFAVDVSDFPYSRYFGPEASNPFALVGTLFRAAVQGKASALEPLYVRDLVTLAQRAANGSQPE